MHKLIVGTFIPLAALLAVAGCAQSTKPETVATTTVQSGQVGDAVVADNADASDASDASEAAVPAMLPLTYSWANEYRGFVSTPVEILRKGRAACQQRDFEVATIGTIGLKGDMVTVTFICRGDVE